MYNGWYTDRRSVFSMKFLIMIAPVLVMLAFMKLSSGMLASGSFNPLVLMGVTAIFIVLLLNLFYHS